MSTTFPTRSLRAVLAALLVALCAPAGALAHGDLAGHYLETSALYPSFSSEPSQAVELQLLGLLAASERAGYPLKVALVADEGDVADTPAMLREPQVYADFVVAELKGMRVPVKAPVVIVTPYGIGVSGPGAPQVGLRRPAAGGGNALAQAAITAVRRVAAAGGHPLPAHVPAATVAVVPQSSPDSGLGLGGLTPLVAFAAVFGAAAAVFEIRSRISRRRGMRRATPLHS